MGVVTPNERPESGEVDLGPTDGYGNPERLQDGGMDLTDLGDALPRDAHPGGPTRDGGRYLGGLAHGADVQRPEEVVDQRGRVREPLAFTCQDRARMVPRGSPRLRGLVANHDRTDLGETLRVGVPRIAAEDLEMGEQETVPQEGELRGDGVLQSDRP